MSATDAAVRIAAVSHQFPKTGSVLENINLEIAPGEFVALLGPSGCGKSTLLRLISGLESPTSGTIHLKNQSKSFVFQDSTLLPWRTALNNVELPLELLQVAKSEREARARNSLASMRLSDSVDKYPNELSGGMKMRVSVARSLITDPSLLLLDEPFAALDENTRFSLQSDLRNRWLSRQPSIIFVTHSISEAVFLADRIIVLSGRPGKIVAKYSVKLGRERAEAMRLSVEFLNEVRNVSELVKNHGAKSE